MASEQDSSLCEPTPSSLEESSMTSSPSTTSSAPVTPPLSVSSEGNNNHNHHHVYDPLLFKICKPRNGRRNSLYYDKTEFAFYEYGADEECSDMDEDDEDDDEDDMIDMDDVQYHNSDHNDSDIENDPDKPILRNNPTHTLILVKYDNGWTFREEAFLPPYVRKRYTLCRSHNESIQKLTDSITLSYGSPEEDPVPVAEIYLTEDDRNLI